MDNPCGLAMGCGYSLYLVRTSNFIQDRSGIATREANVRMSFFTTRDGEHDQNTRMVRWIDGRMDACLGAILKEAYAVSVDSA